MNQTVTDSREDLAPVRRNRARLFVGLALAVALVAAGLGTWLALRPDAPRLMSTRIGGNFDAESLPVATSAGFAGIVMPGDGTRDDDLVFHGIPVVHFSTNTARATAKVAACVRRPDAVPIGAGHVSDLAQACSAVRYLRSGSHMHWLESHGSVRMSEYLILVVTPTQPGRATVDRVTFDYSDGEGHSGKDVGTLEYTVRAS